jgi:hypothetical protein
MDFICLLRANDYFSLSKWKKERFFKKNNIISDESDPIKWPEKEISIENEHLK